MASHAIAPAQPEPRFSTPSSFKALFYVTGVADPGLLPRLIEPVAKMGHVPARVHASREAGDGTELVVDLRLKGINARTAELVEHALRAIVGVRQVIAVVEPDD
ncbi:MAG: hypothetical protein KJZ80_20030 [Hyphomicrobiaceae bacterium]|nr:hypothetical protein [Hyphomicrobiaceae bacterium]